MLLSDMQLCKVCQENYLLATLSPIFLKNKVCSIDCLNKLDREDLAPISFEDMREHLNQESKGYIN